jgi:dTDP-L-rhamnose 4-epimerase
VKPELTRKFRAGDIRHCVADISHIRKLGYAPSTKLADGLRELVDWGKDVTAEDRVEQAARELESRGLTKG